MIVEQFEHGSNWFITFVWWLWVVFWWLEMRMCLLTTTSQLKQCLRVFKNKQVIGISPSLCFNHIFVNPHHSNNESCTYVGSFLFWLCAVEWEDVVMSCSPCVIMSLRPNYRPFLKVWTWLLRRVSYIYLYLSRPKNKNRDRHTDLYILVWQA